MKNNNKFNKTINPSRNEPPLGWWKFTKNQYITTNHPSTGPTIYKLKLIENTIIKRI